MCQIVIFGRWYKYISKSDIFQEPRRQFKATTCQIVFFGRWYKYTSKSDIFQELRRQFKTTTCQMDYVSPSLRKTRPTVLR